MNYGGIDIYTLSPTPWHPWRQKFLWMPKKINGRYYWLRNVHERFRMTHLSSGIFEYQYAVDIFDLMKKDNEKI